MNQFEKAIKPNEELIKELDQCCGKERILTDTWENKEDNQVCLTYTCLTCQSYISALENKEKPIIIAKKQYYQIWNINQEIQNKICEIENLLEKIKSPEECYSLPSDDADR
ncbi:hypothetical protein [endosymbiont GvMRE of Glomus versiforme]|uniref:hypothetical protein n=1 Tax=endosymbiont GvMRE of Glomus versiforme TaxID=2039283 RepID=UPI000EC0A33E|nr:hypothetical protein [endosymbiont GvMRE of Glomus versiforme]RHZ37644.1 hypothetical protein GvMRE_I1g515 [endosymbiont GvMRE of Glomus versiforme]